MGFSVLDEDEMNSNDCNAQGGFKLPLISLIIKMIATAGSDIYRQFGQFLSYLETN
jgi:hypothetical protein